MLNVTQKLFNYNKKLKKNKIKGDEKVKELETQMQTLQIEISTI